MPEPRKTVPQRLADTIAQYPARPALSMKPPKSKEWATLTFAEVGDRIRRLSLGVRALGLERGDRVAILSENRTEWALTDQAVLASGAVSVPIYPTLPHGQVEYILHDCGARAVVVSDVKQRQKVEQCRAACPELSFVIAMDAAAATDGALSFDSVLERGDTAAPAESFEARRGSLGLDEMMSIVYTSGTTGNPKGAVLTHGNMAAALDGVLHAIPVRPPDETFLSFLPLSHIFERAACILTLTMGAHAYYNDSIFKLADNMAEVRPTIMNCVPRVFESIHEKILDGVAKAPESRQKLFFWAVGIGDAVATRRNAGRPVRPGMALQYLAADKLVLQKIRARLGGRLRFFVSGGAALNSKTAHFFNAIGIPVLEAWGLTETTAASAINPLGRAKVGTVGRADFGADVKIAPDGEILVKGPTVMRGYWNLPEATAEAIDPTGWFHTGDIGEIDAQGYIKITDRKKDILVLANGKNVAPQPIETLLRQSPYIGEIVLLGDATENVKALVVPNFDALKAWAKEQGMEKTDPATLAADPAVRKLIKSDIDQRSTGLADFEKVKRIALIDHPFSIEGGELTPTLKVKRKVVAEKYGMLLERGDRAEAAG